MTGDPVATTFDTFVGALAGACATLGLSHSVDEVSLATGRAFRLAIEPRLRPLLPELDRASHEAGLRALGLRAEVLAAEGPEVAPGVLALAERVRAGAPALLYGAGGPVYGLVARATEDALVARSALAAKPLELPIARLARAARLYALVLSPGGEPEPLELRAIAREELAPPSPGPVRGPAAYEAWARALASHPLSRIAPEGIAWKLAELDEGRRAARLVLADDDLALEHARIAELRALFPLPDAGSLSSERLERGATMLGECATLLRRWLERASAGTIARAQ